MVNRLFLSHDHRHDVDTEQSIIWATRLPGATFLPTKPRMGAPPCRAGDWCSLGGTGVSSTTRPSPHGGGGVVARSGGLRGEEQLVLGRGRRGRRRRSPGATGQRRRPEGD